MLTKIFSKPIFRLSMVILVNENILHSTAVLSREIKQRNFARWSARKPSKVFSSDEIPPGSIDSEEFFKSEYVDKESAQNEPLKHSGEQNKGERPLRENKYSSKKPLKVFSSDDIPPGSIDSEEFFKSEYVDKESVLNEPHKHSGEKNKDEHPLKENKYSSRKPSKAFSSDYIPPGNIDSEEFFKSDYVYKESVLNEPHKHSGRKNKGEHQFKEKKYSSSNTDYVVLEEHDFMFSKLMTHVGNRNMRRKHDLMMLEGKRLNLDALQAGLKPKKIFFTQKSFLNELDIPPDTKVPLFKLPYKTTKLWSKLDTPPGIIGFYSIPKEGDIATVDTIPVKVLCDNVRDPGNMGSIIRVAASVGCTEIFLMKGCTDPWDSKVLRSAAGGHFHIPIKMDLTWRDHRDFLNPSDSVFLADSNSDREHAYNHKVSQLLYHEVNYINANSSIVVVIGGETEGLSHDAFTLASMHNGSRLYVPLSNCMESLNSGCALSVVLFEIKRQILLSSREQNTKCGRTLQAE